MIKKIINKNLPDIGKAGQYNFDTTLENISIDGNKQLYSLVDSSQQNVIDLSNSNYKYIDTATFEITKAEVLLTGDGNTDSYDHDFRIYFFDDENGVNPFISYNEELHTFNYLSESYTLIDEIPKGQIGRWYDGRSDSDHFGCDDTWYPGDLANWVGSDDNDECEEWRWGGGDYGWFNWNDWQSSPEIPGNADLTILNFPYSEGNTEGEGNPWSSFINPNFPIRAEHNRFYYIIIWTKAHDNQGFDENRKKTYTVYPIPKSFIRALWNHDTLDSLEIKFTGSTYTTDFENGLVTFPRPNYTQGGTGLSPKYKGGDLSITINLNGEKDLNTRSNWANLMQKNYFNLIPENPIDYQLTNKYQTDEIDIYSVGGESYLDNSDIFDFRPISYVSVSNQWDFDLQQFYDLGDGYVLTTAPNQVDLSFRISENSLQWYPNYIDGYNDDVGNFEDININYGGNGLLDSGINFMMYVYDWEAQDMEFDWEYIVNDFPTSYDELNLKQRRGIYQFENLFNSTNGTDWEINSIKHQYGSAGSKIIKAVVFSYIHNSTEYDYNDIEYFYEINDSAYITPLRWKAVNIIINLNIDSAFVDDFGDIGGFDYRFIPWPETTPIISGLSTSSTYYKSLQEIIQKNNFTETEIFEYSLSHMAYENLPGRIKNELGKYLGKNDLSQIRYFNKPYDMNDLLMLDDTDGFIKYDDFSQWYSYNEETNIDNGMPQYPRNENGQINSCVGLLFIKDDDNIDRIESCIIELNFNVVKGITIRDTSGNDNRGLLMGDYSIDKPDFNIPLTREEPSEMAEINSEKLAF